MSEGVVFFDVALPHLKYHLFIHPLLAIYSLITNYLKFDRRENFMVEVTGVEPVSGKAFIQATTSVVPVLF